ncbi:MAG: FAD:protein FMN transferase [Rikenellaceae bacterium]|nr:FAD:protein FMN transferase [Rikenellaceae bacterium]MCL2692470.1 FAD:protein FMN transferase [Rikenellaceae bacterium]
MNIFKAFAIAAVVLLCSCGGRQQDAGNYVRLETGFAFGTVYNITVNLQDTSGLRRAVDSLFAAVTSSMSVYDPESLLSRLNRNETREVDEHISYCIRVAANVSELCGGEYDVTLKPVIDAWGFNAGVPTGRPERLDSLMQFVGYEKIAIEDGRLIKKDLRTQIDLNSIAKGYAVDLLAQLMEAHGATDYMLEVGGEIVSKGLNARGREWTVGIDRPVEGGLSGADHQAIIRLGTGALATSGNYRKFYIDPDGEQVVHTVSGTTGEARTNDMLSATVIAPTCTLADAWATMLMAVGAERARELLAAHPDVEGYLIYIDAHGGITTYASPEFESRIVR